jgi:hypothetical protein
MRAVCRAVKWEFHDERQEDVLGVGGNHIVRCGDVKEIPAADPAVQVGFAASAAGNFETVGSAPPNQKRQLILEFKPPRIYNQPT